MLPRLRASLVMANEFSVQCEGKKKEPIVVLVSYYHKFLGKSTS